MILRVLVTNYENSILLLSIGCRKVASARIELYAQTPLFTGVSTL